VVSQPLNVVLFFEGTGQGVAGSFTNVTRLRNLCVDDEYQRLHLESGPGTHFGAYAVGAIHGIGWRQILRRAKTWFGRVCAGHETKGQGREGREGREKVRIFLFGFSRGALIARRFAEELEAQGFPVAFLGVWDTVDSTINLDVSERCPSNVRVARHAIARDETRRFFSLVPLLPSQTPQTSQSCSQLVFPGSHSDVGGLYPDNHVIADASLGWMARCAARAGLRLKPGAEIPASNDFRAAVLHDSSDEPSNLWGAFNPVRRVLKGLRCHASCKLAVTRQCRL